MDDADFLDELRQMVARRASAEHLVDTLAFVCEVAERLQEDPVFGEFRLAEYSSQDSKKRPLKIHGYTEFDDSDGTISLVIGRWQDDAQPDDLVTADVAQLRSCLENFATAVLTDRLSERMVPSTEAYVLADTLQNRKSEISCIRLHIFSNQKLTQRFKKEFRSTIAGVTTETHVWDLRRLLAMYSSDRERELVEIDLKKDFRTDGIPCLEASDGEGLRSYLCVINGDILADLYERYGSRLLEGNVRSFLGLKGKVNTGIRNTIQDARHRFFAYNNGIAATAATVQTEKLSGTTRIVGLSDLQIVNGGQTTASILRARKQDKLSLEGVAVPMKLTVVAKDIAQELIPRIAEFANTQNKVAVADFFANHPIHRRMEEISRRLLVPAKAGVRVQSKWFYERSRGQYQNERLYLSKAKKDSFDLEFPPKQVINKTELAKYDSVLDGKPHWAALGVQKNFGKFAAKFSPKGDKSESEQWEEMSPLYGEDYYKRIVAMAILWKAGESAVSGGKGDWYKGDYRSQIVAYAWSFLFQAMKGQDLMPDLGKIWDKQGIDEQFELCFKRAAIKVQETLLDLPQGNTNVGEYAKKESCWQRISALDLNIAPLRQTWTIAKDDYRSQNRDSRKRGTQDDEIELQQQVVKLAESGYWRALYGWPKVNSTVHGPDKELLRRASTLHGAVLIAVPKDWKKLLDIKKACEEAGFRAS